MIEIELSAPQRRAVETRATEAIVVAGAGSGKTRCLTARVLWLLREGASPSEIMVLTFTRKAAAEMRSRIVVALEGAGHQTAVKFTASLMMGTFHSVAFDIFRSHGNAIGYDSAYTTIISPADADMLLESRAEYLGFLRNGKWAVNQSWKAFAEYRESYYHAGEHTTDNGDPLRLVLEDYHRELRLMNVLDFGMVLLETNRLLSDDAVRAAWQHQIKHVLVDEAQDCDRVQYVLHDHFAPPATFFAVGDVRQCIYGFRGARSELMMSHRPDAEVYHLQECYRAGPPIVCAANCLIKHNDEPQALPMISAVPNEPAIVQTLTGRSFDIVRLLLKALAGHDGFHDVGWGDIAILARSHRTLVNLANKFAQEGIPYHRVGSLYAACDSVSFNLVHATLRMIANKHDRLAHHRILRAFGMTGRTLAESPVGPHEAIWPSPGVRSFQSKALSFLELLQQFATSNDVVGDIVATIVGHLPGDPGKYDSALHYWFNQCAELRVEEALRWFAFKDSQDDLREGDYVTLATVHSTKGLEWPIVIIAEMNEGLLPLSRTLRTPEGLREERRVCYVAMTRAQKRLVLHYRMPEDQHPTNPGRARSRFIYESSLEA